MTLWKSLLSTLLNIASNHVMSARSESNTLAGMQSGLYLVQGSQRLGLVTRVLMDLLCLEMEAVL